MLYQCRPEKINYEKFQESEYLPYRHEGFSTKAVHVGQAPQQIHGSINIPIYLSSTFVAQEINFKGATADYNNPTFVALEECYSALEYGKYGLAFSSGNGATSSIIHTLKKGDHVLVCDIIYGGTQGYLKKYAEQSWNLDIEFIDMLDLDLVEKSLKPTTRLVWMETPTNPHLKMIDIELIIKAVKRFNDKIITVIDNTFCTPYLQSPLLLGADISYSSVTKYIGGHSDIVMGIIAMNSNQLYEDIKQAREGIGAFPSAMDSYLALRGLKTLEQRILAGTKNAYHLARFLQKHSLVEQVLYPGLKSHPQYEIARKQMRGYGAMISFMIKGSTLQRLSKFLRSLKVVKLAQSLGGVQSSMKIPAYMNDKIFLNEIKTENKLTNALIRFSVGLQSLEDLLIDLDQALNQCHRDNKESTKTETSLD